MGNVYSTVGLTIENVSMLEIDLLSLIKAESHQLFKVRVAHRKVYFLWPVELIQ